MLRKRCAKCPGALQAKSHGRSRNKQAKVYREKLGVGVGAITFVLFCYIQYMQCFFFLFKNNVFTSFCFLCYFEDALSTVD